MDMCCFVSIVTTMTSLILSLTSASKTNFPLGITSMDYTFETSTFPSFMTSPDVNAAGVTCCSGVLGYASDNVSLNFPCQFRPCCNKSHIQAVVPIEYALGFRFQCMPRSIIYPLCYDSGSEVRTSNQDPDFTPRACCDGFRFVVELNNWYAALVIKCVATEDVVTAS